MLRIQFYVFIGKRKNIHKSESFWMTWICLHWSVSGNLCGSGTLLSVLRNVLKRQKFLNFLAFLKILWGKCATTTFRLFWPQRISELVSVPRLWKGCPTLLYMKLHHKFFAGETDWNMLRCEVSIYRSIKNVIGTWKEFPWWKWKEKRSIYGWEKILLFFFAQKVSWGWQRVEKKNEWQLVYLEWFLLS